MCMSYHAVPSHACACTMFQHTSCRYRPIVGPCPYQGRRHHSPTIITNVHATLR
eukprot:jgi/Mesvir1/18282/Mv26550-RA.1